MMVHADKFKKNPLA